MVFTLWKLYLSQNRVLVSTETCEADNLGSIFSKSMYISERELGRDS